MTLEIAVLEGDGIGPEIVAAALRVVEECETKLNLEIDYGTFLVGWEAYHEYGASLPAHVPDELEGFDGWLLGTLDAGEYPKDDDLHTNPSGALRSRFDLYANIRPTVSYTGISPYDGVDLLIVRQNTEGFYADRNMQEGDGRFMPTSDIAMSVRVITRKECQRIAKKAFEWAADREKKVAAVHKANVLQHGGGLFLEECRSVAETYPDIALEDYHVDAFAMELVKNPEKYDVVVTTNLFGDILSDQASGLAGSLGLAPGLNVGDEYAMAQATHGSAPDIAGEGIANPTGEILSMGMLLKWLGRQKEYQPAIEASRLISEAITQTIEQSDNLTPDIGGNSTTEEFTDAVIRHL